MDRTAADRNELPVYPDVEGEELRMASHKIVSRKQALDLILGSTYPLETIQLPLEKTLNYIASENIYASADIPRFDRAAMDGYAICSKDTANATKEHPVRLAVVGDVHPSTADLAPIETGQAARIFTGGAIPLRADVVVREEDVRYTAGTIEIQDGLRPCQHVWKKGKAVTKGALILQQGEAVSPAVLRILAALQITKVPVTRRPEVCILAIGNELIDLHDRFTGHKIVASNMYMLSAMIEQYGGRVKAAKISRNDKDAVRQDIEEGLKSDLLITTGGSSNASSDLTRPLMEEMGIDLRFAAVSMRPGKGTSFGLYDKKPVFGLPGTPSAVYVAFYTLVLPALLRLRGFKADRVSPIKAILEQGIKKKPGIEHLAQGLVRERDSAYHVLPLAGPDIEISFAMTRANGLIIIDPDKSCLNKGETVLVQPLYPFEPSFLNTSLPEKKVIQGQGAIMAPIVSIVGKSDAGKTTLLEKLVSELTARGYRIGTIKHDVHGFDIDHEGKDSWRHKHAGARTVAISSPKKVAVIRDVETEETIDGLAAKYFQEVDIILTEGYKRESKPKIEVFRSQVHDKPLCKNDDHLVALVSDIPLDLGVPRFELNDIKGLGDFLEQRFLTKSSHLKN
jgi:molybdopterin-guanine dinucleotide biosynthesis protein MobB